MERESTAFWNYPADRLLSQLHTSEEGLTEAMARERLAQYGPNVLKPGKQSGPWGLLLSQFKSPIIIILIAAALLSFFLGDHADTYIIMVIILISGLLGYWQEKGAADAVRELLAIVQVKATVLRDGKDKEIPVEGVVPGDIIELSAGDGIPGDCVIIRSDDLFVDEAALTGETYPVEKKAGVVAADAPLAERTNSLFMGTHAVSGTARAVIIRTGLDTEFGQVSQRLSLRAPETEFERGIRQFGFLLAEVTLLLVIGIFAVNVYYKRPVLESFLFALALAVGLTPQLLPAIISINLARGAKIMAGSKVIVKRLSAIENFGSMNVLCSDKTGTLTEGVVRIHSALDIDGRENEKVLLYTYLNSFFETSFQSPIDEAVRNFHPMQVTGYRKLDEVPYDFIRKRLSIMVAKDKEYLMVTKGALKNILEVCTKVDDPGDVAVDIKLVRDKIDRQFATLSQQGFRVLGVAYRNFDSEVDIAKEDEREMTFLGFLVLFDPPKAGITETIQKLQDLGVSLKVITGDNQLVATSLGSHLGLDTGQILTGPDLHKMSNEALQKKVNEVDLFAEIEPNQKERIIHFLQKSGNVVGYIGDGINDASALHSADVGISVNSAVDVAKDAADIVLLEKSLDVLVQGVHEGRVTFANTLKYVFMATSANFGNMFSMAGASLFISFLPLLPKQILLTNLMTDFPEMTIATDSVDQEIIEKPRRWDISFIRKFMFIFGLLSSVFDYLTFGALILMLKADTNQFRTGWFVESVISAAMIVLIIRTRKPFFKSKPGKYLFLATLAIVLVVLGFPYTPLGRLFGFTTLPALFYLVLGIILLLYIFSAELAKKYFYHWVKF